MSKPKMIYYSYHQKTTSTYKDRYGKTENLALKSNYFVTFSRKENEDVPPKVDEQWVAALAGSQKFVILEEIKKNVASLLANISAHKQVEFFSAVADSRLLVGLGNAHVKETHLNLHHTYGVPYIPGSSLKGICRHYVVSEILDRFGDNLNCLDNLLLLDVEGFLYSKDIEVDLKKKTVYEEKNGDRKTIHNLKEQTLKLAAEYISILVAKQKAEKKEEKLTEKEEALAAKEINWKELDLARAIFGNNDQAGGIVFYDAFPQRCNIDLDIMNPHYSDYYGDDSGKKMPVDSENPIPIKFIAVGTGSTFRFALSNRGYGQDNDLLHQAKAWLQKALENQGVGAKTAVGYGFFNDFKDLGTELEAQSNK